MVSFRYDPKTRTYRCQGGQYATGGDEKTGPFTPWPFANKFRRINRRNGYEIEFHNRKPMVYHQSLAWGVNSGLRSYLDGIMAHAVFGLLPRSQRQEHGLKLLRSGLALNAYNFVIVDAAMTDLARPAIYQAEHFVYPAALGAGAAVPPRRSDYASPGGVKVDIVGGVCETTDLLAADRVLPGMHRGDLVAVFSAGAYGFVMSSQYNSRPRCAEVLVEGEAQRVIRRRETYQDLYAPELDV